MEAKDLDIQTTLRAEGITWSQAARIRQSLPDCHPIGRNGGRTTVNLRLKEDTDLAPFAALGLDDYENLTTDLWFFPIDSAERIEVPRYLLIAAETLEAPLTIGFVHDDQLEFWSREPEDAPSGPGWEYDRLRPVLILSLRTPDGGIETRELPADWPSSAHPTMAAYDVVETLSLDIRVVAPHYDGTCPLTLDCVRAAVSLYCPVYFDVTFVNPTLKRDDPPAGRIAQKSA